LRDRLAAAQARAFAEDDRQAAARAMVTAQARVSAALARPRAPSPAQARIARALAEHERAAQASVARARNDRERERADAYEERVRGGLRAAERARGTPPPAAAAAAAAAPATAPNGYVLAVGALAGVLLVTSSFGLGAVAFLALFISACRAPPAKRPSSV